MQGKEYLGNNKNLLCPIMSSANWIFNPTVFQIFIYI